MSHPSPITPCSNDDVSSPQSDQSLGGPTSFGVLNKTQTAQTRPSRPAHTSRSKRTRTTSPTPLVRQLMEMGFPRKSVEHAIKALGKTFVCESINPFDMKIHILHLCVPCTMSEDTYTTSWLTVATNSSQIFYSSFLDVGHIQCFIQLSMLLSCKNVSVSGAFIFLNNNHC